MAKPPKEHRLRRCPALVTGSCELCLGPHWKRWSRQGCLPPVQSIWFEGGQQVRDRRLHSRPLQQERGRAQQGQEDPASYCSLLSPARLSWACHPTTMWPQVPEGSTGPTHSFSGAGPTPPAGRHHSDLQRTGTASAPSHCVHAGLDLPGHVRLVRRPELKGAELSAHPTWSLSNQELLRPVRKVEMPG